MSHSRDSSMGKMIIGLAGLVSIAASMIVLHLDKPSGAKLTASQERSFLVYAKYGTVDNMKALGCESAVADFMSTARWQDRWCAEKYNHLFSVDGLEVKLKGAL